MDKEKHHFHERTEWHITCVALIMNLCIITQTASKQVLYIWNYDVHRAQTESTQFLILFIHFLFPSKFSPTALKSWLLQLLWCSHYLLCAVWPSVRSFHPFTVSVTNVEKQQRATDRQTGTRQHAENCTLFWHNRNACFPTEALDTKHVLTTVLLNDNMEVYVIRRSAPFCYFHTTTT